MLNLTHEGRRRAIPWLLHELAHPTSQRPPIPDRPALAAFRHMSPRRSMAESFLAGRRARIACVNDLIEQHTGGE